MLQLVYQCYIYSIYSKFKMIIFHQSILTQLHLLDVLGYEVFGYLDVKIITFQYNFLLFFNSIYHIIKYYKIFNILPTHTERPLVSRQLNHTPKVHDLCTFIRWHIFSTKWAIWIKISTEFITIIQNWVVPELTVAKSSPFRCVMKQFCHWF